MTTHHTDPLVLTSLCRLPCHPVTVKPLLFTFGSYGKYQDYLPVIKSSLSHAIYTVFGKK